MQIPLYTARLLAEHGHEPTLLTTKARPEHELPALAPAGMPVFELPDATRVWPQTGTRPTRAALHAAKAIARLRRERFDAIHLFGHTASATLACLVRAALPKTPVIFSTIGPLHGRSPAVQRALGAGLKRLSAVCALTEWSGERLGAGLGVDAELTRPGLFKTVQPAEPGEAGRDTVLFWRNAGFEQGADLCIAAYGRLAPAFPDIQFRFAVRPHDVLEDRMRDLATRTENVHLHVFPYETGPDFPTLLGMARFCVFPFRSLTISPQMAILETMHAGRAVVVSDIESNPEVVQDGRTGLVIPGDDEAALTAAIRRLLEEPEVARTMGVAAAADVRARWSWTTYYDQLAAIYHRRTGIAL